MLAAAIRANLHVLQQGRDLLTAINPALYATRVPACFNAAPGGHLRHVLDHYFGLLDGLPASRVDYEHRARDPRIEGEAGYAAGRVDTIMERLRALVAEDQALLVRAETSGNDGEAWSASSLLRELEFLLSHTVHHYALIATMCRLLGHEPAADFGMAPSTLKHLQACGTAGA